MNTSLWADQAELGVNFPKLEHSIETDICIIGAGFTGLWTAYWLTELAPQLTITILEANYAGFGASGRNGGWFSALFPSDMDKIAMSSDAKSAVALQKEMNANVVRSGEVISKLGIECGWAHEGSLNIARNKAQLNRATAEIAYWRKWGFDESDHRFIAKSEFENKYRITNQLGAIFTPHCARIQPAKLVKGLVNELVKRGVKIFEQSPVTDFSAHQVAVNGFQVKTNWVVRATEAYTANFNKHKRDVIPVYSLMIATEPIPEAVWDEIGLHGETFADLRHLLIYGQRTADNRFAFGGRGAPYHFGSRISPALDRNPKVHIEIRKVLDELFPMINPYKTTHTWGGPLGIPRDWYARVDFDEINRIATGGSYVGDGVGTSALAGITIAEKIAGVDSHRQHLPWINRQSRKWEYEPIRWIGANVGLRVMGLADTEERLTGKPSAAAQMFSPFIGHV
jgi:glycine/D-amino acid oxidase-like deaminating enzyme